MVNEKRERERWVEFIVREDRAGRKLIRVRLAGAVPASQKKLGEVGNYVTVILVMWPGGG